MHTEVVRSGRFGIHETRQNKISRWCCSMPTNPRQQNWMQANRSSHLCIPAPTAIQSSTKQPSQVLDETCFQLNVNIKHISWTPEVICTNVQRAVSVGRAMDTAGELAAVCSHFPSEWKDDGHAVRRKCCRVAAYRADFSETEPPKQ